MNQWIDIGKIVNTHGIKGEIRILSDFDKKERVFVVGFPIYIGDEKRKETIASYRHHKNFEMICFENISNINEVLKDIGKDVYIKREDLKLKEEEYLLEDLVDYEVVENEKMVGKVKGFVYNKSGILLEVKAQTGKSFYIPNNSEFVQKIDFLNKKIWTQNIRGLML